MGNQSGLKQGGCPKFWDLWDLYREDLYRLCLKMMNGFSHEAEDALSAAMIHAREKMSTWSAEIINFKGWLFRLTYNICIDILRKRNREIYGFNNIKKTLPGVDNYHEGVACFESSEEAYWRETALDRIYTAIERLLPRLREPAILRFFLKMGIMTKMQLWSILGRCCLIYQRALSWCLTI